MLDKNNLAQLQQLKQQLEDQKEYATGVVKSTQRRFGFVVVDDGREIFLSPEQMLKVFPCDTVKVLINTDDKGKVSGSVEKVDASALSEFTGRYVVKGQGHFVEPDLPRFNRWIFVPNSARNGAKPGDYVHCKITRHPYPHAKPQAKVLNVIGSPDKPGIEADYMICKFTLGQPWPKNWQQSLVDINTDERKDLCETPFVTIDSADTQDLDDAVYAQTTDNGWQLQVAIADPTAHIRVDSALEKVMAARATSVYLPGKNIPMLPAQLANEQCSLLPLQQRAALVCTLTIDHDGHIKHYDIIEAMIRSHARLNYSEVADALDNNTTSDSCSTHLQTLTSLHQLSQALRQRRSQDNLVIGGRPDYQFVLNDRKKLERIEIRPKNCAHILVEECMVAVNRCAADMLGDRGLFINHRGFRKERLPDVCKLAQEQLSLTNIDASTPEGYRDLMAGLGDQTLTFPLRSVLSRLLERSQFSNQASPHFGMGLPAYTTFTSPIRKYNDYLVQRLIKAKLAGQSMAAPDQESLDALQRVLANTRQAKSQMEQWLKCQFAQALIGQRLMGHVSQINSNAFTVMLDDSLIEGVVETKPLTDKYSFDPMRLRLSSKTRTIELDQPIEVAVKSVNCAERSIHFTLPD